MENVEIILCSLNKIVIFMCLVDYDMYVFFECCLVRELNKNYL